MREREIIVALTWLNCFRQQHGLLLTVSVANLDWRSLFNGWSLAIGFGEFKNPFYF